MELSPLFSDDSRVAEAASIAQKLRKLTLTAHNSFKSFWVSSLSPFEKPSLIEPTKACSFFAMAFFL